MGKTKKKSAQNPNAVTKQLIHGIKNDSVQKNKSPKSKGVSGSRAALTDNSKMQNENKPSQKNLQKTTTKSNQNLLQNNKKEDSLKRKKNTSNKSQNKPAKKMKKKELEIDDLWTKDSFDNLSFILDYEEKEKVDDGSDVLKKNVVDKWEEDSSSSLSNDSYVTYVSSSIVTDDEEKEVNDGVPSILWQMQSLEDESKKDDEDFEGEDEDDGDGEDEDVEDDNNDDDDDNDNIDKDKNYEKNKKLVNIARSILEEVCEGKYPLPSFENGKINRTTIKIENLPKDTTELEIKSYFELFGPIKSIKFKLDRTLRFPDRFNIHADDPTLPYYPLVVNVSVFIDYHCPLDAEKALRMNGQMFLGNYMIVDYVKDMCYLLYDLTKCVTLRYLSKDADINTIWKIFEYCGEIKYIKLFRNETTRLNDELAIIYFATKYDARKAIELDGTLIFDHQVTVEPTLRPEQLYKVREARERTICNFLKNKKTVRVLVEDRKWREKARQNKNLQHKSDDKAENEIQQMPQKSNVGLVEKKSTSFQGQKANFKQKKKNKK